VLGEPIDYSAGVVEAVGGAAGGEEAVGGAGITGEGDGDLAGGDEGGVELFALADGAAVVGFAVEDEGRSRAAVGVVDGGQLAVEVAFLAEGTAQLPLAEPDALGVRSETG